MYSEIYSSVLRSRIMIQFRCLFFWVYCCNKCRNAKIIEDKNVKRETQMKGRAELVDRVVGKTMSFSYDL
ncbi:hypothetical protein L1987_58293 [Smallanthus sonchifolius]|uniref:Uncharacterized protein n=1 Tax=Smallanthus sonchifolius TaxID=185202 RepID=A0ACB9DF67_9ASTR|nr:hypothetical protein L1987_58293 [Smallanthus sonchifolius]